MEGDNEESKSLESSTTNDQQIITTLKQQVSKLESENRQLHQVINQLRSVRRVTKEDVDSIAAERDKLIVKVDKQAETITQLEIKINTNNDNSKDYENLQYEYNNLLKKHNTLEENLYEANKKIGNTNTVTTTTIINYYYDYCSYY